MTNASPSTMEISAAEAEIYDRQLRLWGIEAQQRMQNSRVLVSGLTTVGAEVVKNLVLAGMNVTIQDDNVVTTEDCQRHFLLNEEDLGKNRAKASYESVQDLNPLTTVTCWDTPLSELEKTHGSDIWKEFKVIILTSAPKEMLLKVNEICRSNGIAFYAAQTFGMDGIVFSDLGKHTYRRSVQSSSASSSSNTEQPPAVPTDIELQFPSLETALNVEWSTLHSKRKRGLKLPRVFCHWQFLLEFQSQVGKWPSSSADDIKLLQEIVEKLSSKNGINAEDDDISMLDTTPSAVSALARTASAEMVHVSAILGGIIGQEIVKAVSQKDEPICNLFYFDGITGAGTTRLITE